MNDTPQPGAQLAAVAAYLDRCEEDALHPHDVAHRLVRAGYTEYEASIVAERYRRRFDEHPLGYAAFLFTTGFTALSLGSASHLLLDRLDGKTMDAGALSFWLTVLVVAAPLAVWSWRWVQRVDDEDLVAVWSRPRRTLATTLVWACGIVGGARLLHYVYTLLDAVADADGASDSSLLVGLANVAVTTSITFPLGVWAFRFLHRFDDEDPSARRQAKRSRTLVRRDTNVSTSWAPGTSSEPANRNVGTP